MARLIGKILLKGITGKFGKQIVLRTGSNGKTILAKYPKKSNKPPSERQHEVRAKFKMAVHYAKKVTATPELSEVYRKKLKKGDSIFQLAKNDFLRNPKIEKIDYGFYYGNKGDKILVTALDDFEVTRVIASINNKKGEIIEKGECAMNEMTGVWKYLTTVSLADISGITIKATAFDNPGNTSELSVTIP